MGILLLDIRYGLRIMRKSPGLTLAAVLALALGIGASTSIFTFMNAVLWRPLPGIEQPERLVQLGRTNEGQGFDTSGYLNYLDYRNRNEAFAGVAAYSSRAFSMSGAGQTERVIGALVSGNYFAMLGVPLSRGRLIAPEDDRTPGGHPVAVISESLWKRRFASRADVIGQTIKLNAYPYTVIGVAGGRFRGTELDVTGDVWVPMTMVGAVFRSRYSADGGDGESVAVERLLRNRASVWLMLVARLKNGTTIEQAQANMNVVARQLEAAYPEANRGRGIVVAPVGLDPDSRVEIRNLLLALMGAVSAVLLIACGNVANLLLARAAARRREMGIRLALGARRSRIARQLLIEALLLSLTAGCAGLLVAYWMADGLAALLPQSSWLDLTPDARVLAFAFGLSVITGLIFGMAPVFQTSEGGLLPALHDGTPGAGRARSRLRSSLVVAQVALSLVLLVSAGLFLRTLTNYRSIDRGFDAEHVMAVSFDLGLQGYRPAAGQAFYSRLLDGVRGLPGVAAASLSETVPLSGSRSTGSFFPEGRETAASGTLIDFDTVAPDFFRTLGIGVIAGRTFTGADQPEAPLVGVVNQTLAQSLWPGQDPVGKRIYRGTGIRLRAGSGGHAAACLAALRRECDGRCFVRGGGRRAGRGGGGGGAAAGPPRHAGEPHRSATLRISAGKRSREA